MRWLSSFFMGLVLISLLDFIVFIGLKLNYIDFYNIKEYFNVFFFDNQPFLAIAILSLCFGYFLLYTPLRKAMQILYLLTLLVFLSVFIPNVSQNLGKRLFMQKELNFMLGKVEFKGDMLYVGRNLYYIYRNDLQKTIRLKKDEVKLIDKDEVLID